MKGGISRVFNLFTQNLYTVAHTHTLIHTQTQSQAQANNTQDEAMQTLFHELYVKAHQNYIFQ